MKPCSNPLNRRQFIRNTSMAAAMAGLASTFGCRTTGRASGQPLYKISLAEWSLHRAIREEQSMTNLDFPKVARREFNIDAVEYVNQLWMEHGEDMNYLRELNRIADGEGVSNVLIMVDHEGSLGDPDDAARNQAVQNHHKWADAARFLGCHSIRVNAATGGVGTYEEQQKRAADGLSKLADYCEEVGLNCIVENHGGLSSNGAWLAGVMRMVGKPNCGTLPDFGNFMIRPGEQYDRYKGVTELMPYAKAVSAKTHEFDANGNEVHTDYNKMMQIVVDFGYHSWVGVEYEGSELSEYEGIRKTRDLLIRVRDELSA